MLLAALLSATCALVLNSTAFGYAEGGVIWKTTDGEYAGPACGGREPNSQPCNIAIAEASSFSSQFGWDASAKNATPQWNVNEPNVGFYFSYNFSGITGPILLEAADLGGPNSAGVTTLGQETSFFWTEPDYNRMNRAGVKVNSNSTVVWCTDLDVSCPRSGTIMLQQTLAHELGHALGLAHPIAGPRSGIVMQCMQDQGEYITTGSDDNNGSHHLYSSLYANYGTPGGSPC